MSNNRVLQSLGVTQLISILQSSSNAKSKGVAREDSDSLYDLAGDVEDIECGVVDKVFAIGLFWIYLFLHTFLVF